MIATSPAYHDHPPQRLLQNFPDTTSPIYEPFKRTQDRAEERPLAKLFKSHLDALQKVEWVVYAKRPFGGPDAVLAYPSRYTHRIAIATIRLVAFDGECVTLLEEDGFEPSVPFTGIPRLFRERARRQEVERAGLEPLFDLSGTESAQ